MGRLFWKFFLAFWLAQVVTSGCVGVAIWLEHRDRGGPPHEFEGRPPMPPPVFGDQGRREPPPGGERPPHHVPMPLVPILAGSVVSLVFAALLAWYFSRPIRSLRSAFEAVAGGKLNTRVGADMRRRSDELADLGADFDRMAERLQLLLESQRRLMHDVSHELRSPLARLQAVVDLIRQQPERTAEFIERLERDTVRMDTLVGELLTLARLDAGMNDRADDEISLADLVADIVHDASFEAAAKGCSISTDIGDQLVVRGNRELLHRAIENVVRNAVQYTVADSNVDISARTVGERLNITVRDHGPGVVEADLGAIFEPFFRSGSRKTAGYGLGLAITRRVLLTHGGNISAVNHRDGGLVATIDLPAA